MGIFGMFDKNKNRNKKLAPKTVTTIGAADEIFGKTPIVKKKTDKDIAVEAILKCLPGSVRIEDRGQLMTDEGFEITILSVDTNKGNISYSSVMTVFIAMPNAESLVCQKYIGRGETKTEAIEKAATNFGMVIADNFKSHDEGEVTIKENSFDGRTHTYFSPKNSYVTTDGLRGVKELKAAPYAHIKDYIEDYLGAKKYYWVELLVTITEGKMTAECLINGENCEELAALVYNGVKQEANLNIIGRYDQTIIIKQHDSTYVKMRENYNKACNELYKNIRIALTVLGNLTDDDDYDSAFAKLECAVKDRQTVWELITFLPELYTEKFFGLKCSHMIQLTIGDQTYRLHEIQLEPIRVIRNELNNFFEKNDPSESFSSNLFALSSRYQAVVEADDKKITTDDFVVGDLCCIAEDNYEIW